MRVDPKADACTNPTLSTGNAIGVGVDRGGIKNVPLRHLYSFLKEGALSEVGFQEIGKLESSIRNGTEDIVWDKCTPSSFHELDSYIYYQATDKNSGVRELISNASDSYFPDSDKIGKFGVGFFQILSWTESGTVSVRTSQGNSEEVCVEFCQIEGELFCSIWIEKNMPSYTGTRIQFESNEPLENSVANTLLADVQESFACFFKGPIAVNGSQCNDLERLKWLNEIPTMEATKDVRIEISERGFAVEDSGRGMNLTEVLNNLLVPKSRGHHNGSEAQHSKYENLGYVSSSNSDSLGPCQIRLQSSGILVETISVEGINLPSELVIEFPPAVSLTESRNQLTPDLVARKTLERLTKELLSKNDPESLQVLNAIAVVARRFDAREGSSGGMMKMLNGVFEEFLKDQTLRVIPNVESFLQLSLPPHPRAIRMDEDLFSFDRPAVGIARCEHFQSDNYTAYIADFTRSNPEDPIFFIHKNDIYLDRQTYEKFKEYPVYLNFLLNFHIEYEFGDGTRPEAKGYFLRFDETKEGQLEPELNPEVKSLLDNPIMVGSVEKAQLEHPEVIAALERFAEGLRAFGLNERSSIDTMLECSFSPSAYCRNIAGRWFIEREGQLLEWLPNGSIRNIPLPKELHDKGLNNTLCELDGHIVLELSRDNWESKHNTFILQENEIVPLVPQGQRCGLVFGDFEEKILFTVQNDPQKPFILHEWVEGKLIPIMDQYGKPFELGNPLYSDLEDITISGFQFVGATYDPQEVLVCYRDGIFYRNEVKISFDYLDSTVYLTNTIPDEQRNANCVFDPEGNLIPISEPGYYVEKSDGTLYASPVLGNDRTRYLWNDGNPIPVESNKIPNSGWQVEEIKSRFGIDVEPENNSSKASEPKKVGKFYIQNISDTEKRLIEIDPLHGLRVVSGVVSHFEYAEHVALISSGNLWYLRTNDGFAYPYLVNKDGIVECTNFPVPPGDISHIGSDSSDRFEKAHLLFVGLNRGCSHPQMYSEKFMEFSPTPKVLVSVTPDGKFEVLPASELGVVRKISKVSNDLYAINYFGIAHSPQFVFVRMTKNSLMQVGSYHRTTEFQKITRFSHNGRDFVTVDFRDNEKVTFLNERGQLRIVGTGITTIREDVFGTEIVQKVEKSRNGVPTNSYIEWKDGAFVQSRVGNALARGGVITRTEENVIRVRSADNSFSSAWRHRFKPRNSANSGILFSEEYEDCLRASLSRVAYELKVEDSLSPRMFANGWTFDPRGYSPTSLADRSDLLLYLPGHFINKLSDAHVRALLATGDSFEKREQVLSPIRLAALFLQESAEIERFINRWLNLVKKQPALARSLIHEISEREKDPTSGLPAEALFNPQFKDAIPESLVSIVQHLQYLDEGLLVTKRRIQKNKAKLVSQLGPISLASVVGASIVSSQSEVRDCKTIADLTNVMTKAADANVNLDTVRDVLVRTAIGQDASGVMWIRELVQNARDAIRTSGVGKRKISLHTFKSENNVVTRVQDPVGMDLGELIDLVLTPDRTDKPLLSNLSGFFGQGFYTSFVDADEVVVYTSKGEGVATGMRIKCTHTLVDGKRVLSDLNIEELWQEESTFKGTQIDRVKKLDPKTSVAGLDAAVISHAVRRYLGAMDMAECTVEYNNKEVASRKRVVCSMDLPRGRLSIGTALDKQRRVTSDQLLVQDVERRTHFPELSDMVVDEFWKRGINIDVPHEYRLIRTRNGFRDQRKVFNEINPALNHLSLQLYIKLFVEKGIDIPGIPRDYLYAENYSPFSISETVLADAALLNQGKPDQVDFSRYQADSNRYELVQLLTELEAPIVVEGKEQLISLRQLRESLLKQKDNVKLPKGTRIRSAVEHAKVRIQQIKEDNQVPQDNIKKAELLQKPGTVEFLRFTQDLLQVVEPAVWVGSSYHKVRRLCHFEPESMGLLPNLYHVYPEYVLPYRQLALDHSFEREESFLYHWMEDWVHELTHLFDNLWTHQEDVRMPESFRVLMQKKVNIFLTLNSPEEIHKKLVSPSSKKWSQ